jgi:hypothetical protein
VLKKNGKFVAKVFQDKEFPDFYYEKVKLLFDNVFYYKPGSSRNTSRSSSSSRYNAGMKSVGTWRHYHHHRCTTLPKTEAGGLSET